MFVGSTDDELDNEDAEGLAVSLCRLIHLPLTNIAFAAMMIRLVATIPLQHIPADFIYIQTTPIKSWLLTP